MAVGQSERYDAHQYIRDRGRQRRLSRGLFHPPSRQKEEIVLRVLLDKEQTEATCVGLWLGEKETARESPKLYKVQTKEPIAKGWYCRRLRRANHNLPMP